MLSFSTIGITFLISFLQIHVEASPTLRRQDNFTQLPIIDHAAIGAASGIPVSDAVSAISFSPIVMRVPGRIVEDMQVRVSVPMSGDNLPILFLAHGHGTSNHVSSLNGYAPLYEFWSQHGFVVIQPTFLDSISLNLEPENPIRPIFWRERVEDIKFLLDNLDLLEQLVPETRGRIDREKIAVAGHSMGGHTAGMLLGQSLQINNESVQLFEPRIKAGVIMAAPGRGDDDLVPAVFDSYPFFRYPDFSTMSTQALVVVGDRDISTQLTIRGADWHYDPYTLSPGNKTLLSMFGGEHLLGGIAAYDCAATTDEDPERVAAVQRLTWAYLRSALYPGDDAWSSATSALENIGTIGRVESK